jgi:uncharacterized protein (TIGR03086 family)
MSEHPDLRPATDRMIRIVTGIPDDALGAPTPCAAYTVGDLLDHVAGFAVAFRHAAEKDPLDAAAAGDGQNLAPDWRTRIPADLDAMARAWDKADAWDGMTQVGGVDLPGDVCGLVGLGELVLHGWDLAQATGQPAAFEGPELEPLFVTVSGFAEAGVEGLFGPSVAIADRAPMLDRIVGVSGRDPQWQPSV